MQIHQLARQEVELLSNLSSHIPHQLTREDIGLNQGYQPGLVATIGNRQTQTLVSHGDFHLNSLATPGIEVIEVTQTSIRYIFCNMSA